MSGKKPRPPEKGKPKAKAAKGKAAARAWAGWLSRMRRARGQSG